MDSMIETDENGILGIKCLRSYLEGEFDSSCTTSANSSIFDTGLVMVESGKPKSSE